MTSVFTRCSRVFAAAFMLAMALPAVRPASAFTVTGIQNNGTDCAPDTAYDSANVQRTSLGLTNNQGSNINLFCPLTPPSHDSYYPGFVTYSIRDVELFYSGPPPIDCYVMFRVMNGGITYSPAMTTGTSSTSGTSVKKLVGAFSVQTHSSVSVSQGIICSVPSGTRILGSTAKHDVTDVTGGI